MDGILLIDKKEAMTSRDVVNMLMRKFKFKKIGHTGTLDPFATGLMVITLGKGTKASPFLESLEKVYVASLRLGTATDTLDKDGLIIASADVPSLNKPMIKRVFKMLTGELEQMPPMYSAIKIDGKPLYELARQGIEIERKLRKITIFSLELIDLEKDLITFKVRCSKGTYVRTLGEQIAEKLNTLGHLESLRRTAVGNFEIINACKVEDVTENHLIKITEALKHMETIIINDKDVKNVKDGKSFSFDSASEVLLVDSRHEALAVYERQDNNTYRSKRGLF